MIFWLCHVSREGSVPVLRLLSREPPPPSPEWGGGRWLEKGLEQSRQPPANLHPPSMWVQQKRVPTMPPAHLLGAVWGCAKSFCTKVFHPGTYVCGHNVTMLLRYSTVC